MYFEIIGEIKDIEVIAIGGGIKDLIKIQKKYGKGRWRKLKGSAKIKLMNGAIKFAEIHWYEANGISKKNIKIKKIIE